MSIPNVELTMLNGSKANFADFAGKAILVVNVASRCGLSPQYEALEALQKKYGARGFTVLGVPSGQFMQELKNSDDIAEYCSATWGVTFPMTEKAKVNGKKRHPLYVQLVQAPDEHGVAGPGRQLPQPGLQGAIHRAEEPLAVGHRHRAAPVQGLGKIERHADALVTQAFGGGFDVQRQCFEVAGVFSYERSRHVGSFLRRGRPRRRHQS